MEPDRSADSAATGDRPFVRTVLGEVGIDELGHVQMHEHVLIDLWQGVPVSAPEEDRGRYLEPLEPRNYYWSRRHHSRDDLQLTDVAVAIEELRSYRRAGGSTIVDVTSVGLGRNPAALAEIARASGTQIVMGCGYYYADYHPRPITEEDLDSVRDEIIADLTAGVGDTGVRAGIIGEIGLSWPHKAAELVVLDAAAQAHSATGAAISIHPGRDAQSPFDAVSRLEQHGVSPSAVIMGHVERTVTDADAVRALAETGCYVEFDLFGQESSYYSLNPAVHMPNDAGRADFIVDLVERGHLEQILVSQDVCHKTNLRHYGGEGYTHVLDRVLPLLTAKGLTAGQTQAITHGNPARALCGGRRGAVTPGSYTYPSPNRRRERSQ